MAKRTKSADKAGRAGKKIIERAKSRSAGPMRRNSAGADHSKTLVSPSRSWGWEALPGVIGEKCFRAADGFRQEVARWSYDPQSAMKFHWKVGSLDGHCASPADAREQILNALARAS